MAKITLLLASAITIISASPMSFDIKQGGSTQAVFVGTVDGKSYFSEIAPLRTWAEAKQACTASGMQLASVSSAAQVLLLKTKYSSSLFLTNMWLGGRDSRTLKQMSWDHNEADVASMGLAGVPVHTNAAIQTCLSWHSSATAPALDLALCSQKYGTLCELVHGLD